MDYSAIFNECCKECALYNPKKCRFDVALLWFGIGFFALTIFIIVLFPFLIFRFRR
uniref:p7 protein n=1 Tax=Sweet potato chlorotic stunt virus TaxID=81931 RepID=A0A410YDF7_9CLOS|nr:p7 protein [Sweet potato chlorotic stunt virus]